MPQIRPISDLRNNFAEISRIVHDSDDPVFLTKNGYGDMVVMSVELYEELGIAAKLVEHETHMPERAKETPAKKEAVVKNDAASGDLKIQKPLSLWQKTLSDFVSK